MADTAIAAPSDGDDFLPGLALPSDVEERLERLQREQPVLSGERLQASRPDAYRAAVKLLGDGHSIRYVAAVTDICVPSVMMIRRREKLSDLTAAQKANMSSLLHDVARLSAEQARERLEAGERIPLDKLMLTSAIATDKAMLLAGEATQRIEHVVRDDGDDWEQEIARARAAGRVIDVDDMGIDPAHAEAKGERLLVERAQVDPLPGEPSNLVPGGLDTLPADILSDDMHAQPVDGAHVIPPDTSTDTPPHPAAHPQSAADSVPEVEPQDQQAADKTGEGGVRVEGGRDLQRYIRGSGLLNKGGSDVG